MAAHVESELGVMEAPKHGPVVGVSALMLGGLGFMICWIPVLNVLGIVLGALAVLVGLLGVLRGGYISYSIGGLALGVLTIAVAMNVNAAVAQAVDNTVRQAESMQARAAYDA